MPARKHELPGFLDGLLTQVAYERWLTRKAAAHVKRDRGRGREGVSGATYRDAIHEAVVHSEGADAYTGERLDWSLLSQYDNESSKQGRHAYKAGFGLLPTVDHIDAAAGAGEFCICAWRTNDAKNDLSAPDFIRLCRRVIEHAGYTVQPPAKETT